MKKYQCSKKLVSHKEYSCFDFLAHSMFTFDKFWGCLGTSTLGSEVQPQIILDPDYLPDYFSVSCDYDTIIVYRKAILPSVILLSLYKN